ncbi:MAG TPA: hypothetical protein VF528_20435 [Pyrinomonadaceae bacterium]|jgi:hypothetical protein
MFAETGRRKAFAFLLILVASFSSSTFAQKKQKQKKPPLPTGTPVLWRDPGDISTRDLRYGSGSAERAPLAPFTFVAEDKIGASPKFKVKDANGLTWVVKLGEESQAEIVATRLVWAMGYFAEEGYYLERAEIKNLPRLSRGQEFVEGGTTVRNVRFEPRRTGVRRGAIWDWLQNPFVGSRELDGLKVLMVLLANYDTRLDNNRILFDKNPESGQMEAQYYVTDIGATLGHVGGLGGKRSKNNLADYRSAKFVIGVQGGVVEFDYNTTPKGSGKFASFFNPGYAKRQANKEKAMRRIPVENARWMGEQLSRLSDDQLRDAFRSAGYDNNTTEGYIKVLRERINQLTRLSSSSSPSASATNR